MAQAILTLQLRLSYRRARSGSFSKREKPFGFRKKVTVIINPKPSLSRHWLWVPCPMRWAVNEATLQSDSRTWRAESGETILKEIR